MANVSFSDDQFRDLLGVLANRDNSRVSQKTGSFASCTARFDGTRQSTVVETFLSTITTYKKIESVSDENAIEGLTLLLIGDAAIWWLGVRETVSTWHETVSLLRTTFAPKRPAYQVLNEIVCNKQSGPTATELFVAKKRALIAELPKPSPTLSQGLDLLYTSLHAKIRDRIPRDSVQTFDEFLVKVRQIEETATEQTTEQTNTGATPLVKRTRCNFCRAYNHSEQECRKKAAKTETSKETPKKTETRPPPTSKITCYGCGEPGVVRSKCPKCNTPKIGAGEVGFYALASGTRLRPTVKISIDGINGQAHIDSGAKMSVASTSLYYVLKRKGVTFNSEKATVTLADGLRRRQRVQSAQVPVTLCGRTIPTTFIVLPETHDNRTLLGVDFIQDASIVLNLPQLLFHFLDEPGKKYDLHNEDEDSASVSTVQMELEETESVIARLASITSLEPMLSPMFQTPSPCANALEEERNMADAYGPPVLIDFCTPPHSPSRQEPTLNGYSPRFVGSLFRDAQSSINNAEITLSPQSSKLFGTNIDIAMVAIDGAASSEEVQLNRLLEQHAGVFTGNGKPATLVEHIIEVGNHKPVAVPPYRVSQQRKEVLRKEIDQMLDDGVITPSKSPWAAPVVMVPKKMEVQESA